MSCTILNCFCSKSANKIVKKHHFLDILLICMYFQTDWNNGMVLAAQVQTLDIHISLQNQAHTYTHHSNVSFC